MSRRTGAVVTAAGIATTIAMTMMMAMTPPARAENAGAFPAPGGSWAGRVPRADCPTACTRPYGRYLEAVSGIDALRHFAASNGPDQPGPNYSPGIVPVPLDADELDTNGDGVRDRYRYAHPFANRFPARRHCSAYVNAGVERGWDAGGGAATILLYEREPADTLDALGTEAFLGGASGCAQRPPGESVRRGVLPVFQLDRQAARACPEGYVETPGAPAGVVCTHPGGAIPERNLGRQCPALTNGSNPVNAVTGNKYQRETDYAGTAHGDLTFARHYNSQAKRGSVLGPGWSHTYDRRLVVTCAAPSCAARAYREDGRVITFNGTPGAWRGDPNVVESLVGPDDGRYVLTDHEGRRETYAAPAPLGEGTEAFRLASIRARDGRQETLAYDGAGRLARVTGPFGRELRFEYDEPGRLKTLLDPSGHRYDYAYDEGFRLASVTVPDPDDVPGDTGTRSNNPSRGYRYEDTRHPAALTGIIDENGSRFATWQYDAAGRAVLSEHAGGANRVSFDYQPGYTSVTDARGQTRSFNVATEFGVGVITAITGSNCNVCGGGRRAAVTYDPNGFENHVTDYMGNVTDLDFDDAGLLVRRTEAAGSSHERTLAVRWDRALRAPVEVTVTGAGGAALRRTTYTWNDGRLTARTVHDLTQYGDPPRTTTFTYFGDDPNDPDALQGVLKRIDGPRDDVADITEFAYDPATGNLVTVTNALGHETRFEQHDADGRPLVAALPNGATVTLRWHPRGWLLARTVDGAAMSFDYDNVGQPVRITLPDGATTDLDWDGAHRLAGMSDALGNARTFALDALGNRVGEHTFDAHGTLRHVLDREYDGANQLTRLIPGAGPATGFEYDANGDLFRVIRESPSGGQERVTTVGRDALRRIVSQQDAGGGTLSLGVDPLDRVTRVTAPNGVVTTDGYNGFGDLRETDSADAGATSFNYDAAGNRVRATDARGVTVNYAYDALNRLVRIDYPTETDTGFTYDEVSEGQNGVGRLTTIVDESGVTRYWYDLRGNVVQKGARPGTRPHATRYRYDVAGRLVEIWYPRGRRVFFDRDLSGRIERVRMQRLPGPVVTLVDAVSYAPFGPVESWVHGNGITMARTYDRDYRLMDLDYSGVALRRYDYDGHGNVAGITDTHDDTRSAQYTYDALDRLVAADGPWGRWAWTWDASGNRLGFASDTWTEQLHYWPGSNRLDGITDGRGAYVDYDTDAAGNTIAGSGGHRFAYGEDGRLDSLVPGAGRSTFTFTHNALGQAAAVVETVARRRRAIVRKRQFAYDEAGRLLESLVLEDRGGASDPYGVVYLDDIPVAAWDAGGIRHLHPDHLGAPIAETDAGGHVVSRTDIAPFAGSPEQGGAWPASRSAAYPGQSFVDGTDYVFLNWHREYDARAGRYLQSDPIGLHGGINPYVYGLNNPVRYVDPAGLRICLDPAEIEILTATISGGLGGAIGSGGLPGALLGASAAGVTIIVSQGIRSKDANATAAVAVAAGIASGGGTAKGRTTGGLTALLAATLSQLPGPANPSSAEVAGTAGLLGGLVGDLIGGHQSGRTGTGPIRSALRGGLAGVVSGLAEPEIRELLEHLECEQDCP